MSVQLLNIHHLEFLSLQEGWTGSSESTLVKLPYCWKSYFAAQLSKSHEITLVCLFDLILYIPLTISVIKGQVFLGWTSTKLGLMFLLKDHNAVKPVRLESAAPGSRVKHSTTEPLRSLTSESTLVTVHTQIRSAWSGSSCLLFRQAFLWLPALKNSI